MILIDSTEWATDRGQPLYHNLFLSVDPSQFIRDTNLVAFYG